MKKLALMGLVLSAFMSITTSETIAACCNCEPTKVYNTQPHDIYLNNLNPKTAPDHERIMAANVTDNTTVGELKKIAREHFTGPDFNKKSVEIYTKKGCGCPLHMLFGSKRLCDSTRLGDLAAGEELEFAIMD